MAVEERLRALEDERAILRTLYRYAHALDYDRDPRDFLGCFTENGVWWSSTDGVRSGAAGTRHEGHADLERWFREGASERGTAGHFTKHIVWKPQVRLAGDRADVESYFATIRETAEGPSVYSLGRCVDTFERSSDGRWRIRERHLAREAVLPPGQSLPVGYE